MPESRPADAPPAAAWFIWVRGLRGPARQKVFSAVGNRPFLDETIKDHVLAQHPLSETEAMDSLDALARRYPAPPIRDTAE